MEKQSSGCAFGAICFIAGAIVSGAICFIAGGVAGNLQVYNNIRIEETDAAKKVMASSPDFAGLHFDSGSKGEVIFFGTVPSAEALERLKESVVHEYWGEPLRIRTGFVEVAEPAK